MLLLCVCTGSSWCLQRVHFQQQTCSHSIYPQITITKPNIVWRKQLKVTWRCTGKVRCLIVHKMCSNAEQVSSQYCVRHYTFFFAECSFASGVLMTIVSMSKKGAKIPGRACRGVCKCLGEPLGFWDDNYSRISAVQWRSALVWAIYIDAVFLLTTTTLN